MGDVMGIVQQLDVIRRCLLASGRSTSPADRAVAELGYAATASNVAHMTGHPAAIADAESARRRADSAVQIARESV